MIKSILRFALAGVIMTAALSACTSESADTTAASADKPIAESAGYADPMDIPVKDITCKTAAPAIWNAKSIRASKSAISYQLAAASLVWKDTTLAAAYAVHAAPKNKKLFLL